MTTAPSLALRLLEELKRQGRAPKVIERVCLGPFYLFNAYQSRPEGVISPLVYTGAHLVEEIALLKALVEMVERQAFFESREQAFWGTLAENTDGLAAWPRFDGDPENANINSRQNAWHEALERFVWSVWWDQGTRANIEILDHGKAATSTRQLMELIEAQVDVSEWLSIQPLVAAEGSYVQIFFARIGRQGFLSGGAAGPRTSRVDIEMRALMEMFRHALAYKRIKASADHSRLSFYERRLLFFARGDGDQIVQEHLGQRGEWGIQLPALAVDTGVPHSLDSLISVWRCLFMGQPPFVGGSLERLCL